MERINLVELLKDCIGIELDCTVLEGPVVVFKAIYDDEDDGFPIGIRTKGGVYMNLTRYGQPLDSEEAKCVIFPKGKTTWEGFVPPRQFKFKNGDIVYTIGGSIVILGDRVGKHSESFHSRCGLFIDGFDTDVLVSPKRLATEEEKEKLFQAIKDNGYEWNAETKTLIQPFHPNFRKDDWVIDKQGLIHQIENVIENVTNHTFGYDIVGGGYFNDNSDVRLWTIKDAKDGDVLVDKYNNIGIFQKCVGIWWYSYIYLGCNGELLGFNTGGGHEQTDTHPATKEEKEKLFQAIKDNGYKWNAETKTLEKLPIPNFKEGDILYCNANDDGEDKDMFKYIFIFDKIVDGKFYYAHCHLFGNKFYETKVNLVHGYPVRFATEEEKQKLFQAIKENSYKWNSETKTLDKLVKLNFKVGNKIRNIKTGQIHTVTHTYGSNKCFSFQVDNRDYAISQEFQDEYELVADKFDINTLVPFESKVLVRDNVKEKWHPGIWGYYDSDCQDYPYKLIGDISRYCIPYEGNEHLRSKIEDCDEYFKTWEKTGD